MKYALGIALLVSVCFCCSQESLQEAISGCEIEEGKPACFDLKNSCAEGYSEWIDSTATDLTKCQCCEKK